MLYGGSLLWQSESILDHCHTKQKSHRFCISASTMASYWSGRRGSNSLPPPWQGGALPDELRPHIRCIYPCTLPFFNGAFAMNCVKKEKVLHDFRRGASNRNRTNDTGIFSPLLYRLSYRGICCLAKCLFSIVEFCGNVKRFFEKSFCGIFKAFSKMCARTHTGRVYAQKTCGGSGAPLAQGRRLMVS